jgi:hypothetical protein
MQDNGIVATVKHFPGHGSVRGDTHHSTIVIDEVPPELSVFKKSIEAGVLSVMVGHIGVAGDSDQFGEIDTYGKPATISRNLVTGLLNESMQFTMRSPPCRRSGQDATWFSCPRTRLSLQNHCSKRCPGTSNSTGRYRNRCARWFVSRSVWDWSMKTFTSMPSVAYRYTL